MQDNTTAHTHTKFLNKCILKWCLANCWTVFHCISQIGTQWMYVNVKREQFTIM